MGVWSGGGDLFRNNWWEISDHNGIDSFMNKWIMLVLSSFAILLLLYNKVKIEDYF